jgi:hypothetical protein
MAKAKLPTRRKPITRGPFMLLPALVPATLVFVDVVQPRAPVLGPPKQPPFAQPHVPMGSPYALLFPPIVVTEPRAPVLGGPKQPLPAAPFFGGSPTVLLAPAVQNPFIPIDYSKPYFFIVKQDATQPTNINLFTNPVPFGPYDYNISHDVVATPAREPPNWSLNINLFTNPVPFGPYDYNKQAKPPPAKEQPNWSLNINLYKNPVPFGPYDYNKVFPPLPSRPFDQQPNYPNFYTNPVPFGPFDWSKPQKPPVSKEPPVWSVNVNLYTNPIPFGPFDWSKPFAQRPLQVVPALPNIALTTVVTAAPFFNADFSRPFFTQVRVDQTQPTNINLFTNPFPFTPVDYNISHDVISSPPQAQPYNINVFTNPVPFGPYDYNKAQKPPPAREPPAWSVNINLLTNPVPFGPFDWNKQWPPLPSRPFEPQPNYPDFYPNPLPFGPFDWSKPITIAGLPPQALPYNIALTTVIPAPPFFNPDFSKPYFLVPLPGFMQVAYGNFYPNPVPFGPFDWSRPSAVRSAPQLPAPAYNILIYSVPFAPIDFSVSRPLPPRAPDQIYPNLTLTFIPPAAPFVPFDWSKTFFPQIRIDQTQPTNINIFTNPIPFGPYDYNRAVTARTAAPPQPQPYNIQIYTNPVPFALYDWSHPATIASVPSAPLPPSIALTTISVPVSFAQVDWSVQPYFPRNQFDASRSLDLELYTNPIPFAQHDWSARPGMFPPRAPDQIYPNLPLRPTVVTVTIIQRTLTGVGL